jgi:GH15 family glucan-1,4-alpha-glucosidase
VVRVSRGAAGAAVALAVATTVAAAAPASPPARRPHPTLATAPSWRLSALDQEWLRSGRVPGWGTEWEDMVEYALLDLRALVAPSGGPLAGAAPSWGYVWPRDAAFVAAAFARTGHLADADRVLAFLARAQETDGGFEARYLPNGSGPPDARRRQSDGAGWALWAVASVAAVSEPGVVARRYESLVRRATLFALRQTEDGTRLPRPSPDYWERPETAVTLGTAAPLLLGLRSGAALLAEVDAAAAARAAGAAESFGRLVALRFGSGGYQRYGPSGGADAAVAFLLPPFAAEDDDVVRAWRHYQTSALRPAGGLAPGAGWYRDGVSWTPQTALVALTAAASGRRATAERWLGWLDEHRTQWGSLPEKVLADGSPAGPAPLAWTAATVVLAVDALG